MDTQGLLDYAESVYAATLGLMRLVPEDKLTWRPADGNWMTCGQLLAHLPEATGLCMNGFINDAWPPPPEAAGDAMLPPAEAMPTVGSVAEAVQMLERDRDLARRLLTELSEDDFRNRIVTAPWAPDQPMPLWRALLEMVEHQSSHKVQLFFYLKLLGLPMNTFTLYGMPAPA